jgi:DNA-binding XRE family transcriptional regulator
MANLVSALNDQIRRGARRESRAQIGVIKRLSSQHRRDIAALKRQVAALRKAVTFLERQERRRVGKGTPAGAVDAPAPGTRFRADGLKSHRAKLGLSAADYGKLVGASGLSVYHWEAGKTRPRPAQVAKIVAVRGLGKREAMKRLELMGK